jgi:hypothetical protein
MISTPNGPRPLRIGPTPPLEAIALDGVKVTRQTLEVLPLLLGPPRRSTRGMTTLRARGTPGRLAHATACPPVSTAGWKSPTCSTVPDTLTAL